MTYMPMTSFRRPVDAAQVTQLTQRQAASDPLPDHCVNKWEVLRDLGTARHRLGVSDRALVVLQALLSFHPGADLGGDGRDLIVFPSNAAICERLNGMPCSTMRRHLGALVQAGLIVRRDSPNGKRYARRSAGGRDAFGFDLSPLPRRHAEICKLAEEVRATEQAYQRLRQTVSLMRRDLAGLAAYGAETQPLPLWHRLGGLAAQTTRALRRTLAMDELRDIEARLLTALNEARAVLEPGSTDRRTGSDTEDMGTKERHSGHHHQNSKTDPHDLEPCFEKAGAPDTEGAPDPDDGVPRIPLPVVRSACPALQTYAPGPLRHWHDLVNAAETVRPMMGISPSAWSEAKSAMGPEQASVVVAAMLERFTDLRSPGGYLRALTTKAEAGTFSCGPMVMALLRRDRPKAAEGSQL